MIGHEMPAAFGAILPLAQFCFLEHRDVFGAGRDAHRFGLPKTEGIHRTAGPGTTGAAMAIAHRLRGAGDFELNRAAKAFSCEAHEYFLV
jgi:hypothetical protein